MYFYGLRDGSSLGRRLLGTWKSSPAELLESQTPKLCPDLGTVLLAPLRTPDTVEHGIQRMQAVERQDPGGAWWACGAITFTTEFPAKEKHLEVHYMRSRICSRLEARDCISSVVSHSTTTTSVSICGILRRSSSKQQLQCWRQDVEDLVVLSVRVFYLRIAMQAPKPPVWRGLAHESGAAWALDAAFEAR